jgi:hypothetical protein
MANDERDEFLRYLQDIVERLERLNVQKAMPKAGEERELEQLEVMLDSARKALARFEEWQRHDLEERRTTAWLDAMNASHATLLKAINNNMKTTNELLRTSHGRLLEIENSVILTGRSAFNAQQDVLDEGEYLYQVLAIGAQGTEAGGPLLKDAPPVVIDPGINVLAHAIEEILEEETTIGTARGRASDDEEE